MTFTLFYNSHPITADNCIATWDGRLMRGRHAALGCDGKAHWAYGTPYLIATTRRDWIEWTPNVITSKVTIEDGKVRVSLDCCTPNFKSYQMKVGDGTWADCDEQVELPIAASGLKRFTFRTVNLFGVAGPEHRVELVRSPDRRQNPFQRSAPEQ